MAHEIIDYDNGCWEFPGGWAAIGWFSLAALPEPLSAVSVEDVRTYLARHGSRSSW